MDGIQTQLCSEPTRETANRKQLRENPLATWEVRIGRYRAFYAVELPPDFNPTDPALVLIVAIGHKAHNILLIRGKVVTL